MGRSAGPGHVLGLLDGGTDQGVSVADVAELTDVVGERCSSRHRARVAVREVGVAVEPRRHGALINDGVGVRRRRRGEDQQKICHVYETVFATVESSRRGDGARARWRARTDLSFIASRGPRRVNH